MNSQNTINTEQTEDVIDLKELFLLCLSRWTWFVAALVIALCAAFLYIETSSPMYTRSMDILIKDDSKGNSLPGGGIGGFSDLGFLQNNTNVNNEIISLKSPSVILEVIKRLHLDMNYIAADLLKHRVLYGSQLPITVSLYDVADNCSASLTVNLLPNNKVELFDFVDNYGEKYKKNIVAQLKDTILTPLGRVCIYPSSFYDSKERETLIHITKANSYSTIEHFSSNLKISLKDKASTIINISLIDQSIPRIEDFLNTLILAYNENWVQDKNMITVSTSMFINERLKVIESDLSNVDEDISSYKSQNLLPDVQAASNMYMTQANEANIEMMSLNNQLYMARYILNYLSKPSSKNQLLPANSGIESISIETQISEHNKLQLERNSLVSNSSEHNPLVIDIEQNLALMRSAIIFSINNSIETLNTHIKNLQENEQQTTSRIAASPGQAKYLLSVERQQKIKETLYLFLLEKREENELSQTFTSHNTRIITLPYGGMCPISPHKGIIVLAALFVAFIFTSGIIIIMNFLNYTIRNRKDLEKLTIPFIGEIPLSYRKKRYLIPFKKTKEVLQIVVKDKNRNIINEAFRIMRTNLEFLTNKDGGSKVMMTASINPGSGKTFVMLNLAATCAISKKVLIIDLDIRKATLSSYFGNPKSGVSNYLSGHINQLSDIIIRSSDEYRFDVIPVGTIPPNPTELLLENRLEQMLNTLREEYDYIFIDCPPIEILADSLIINKLVDSTLFIVRAKLLDRALLSEIEKLYVHGKYKNMSLILNGTTEENSRYGGYSYHKYDI